MIALTRRYHFPAAHILSHPSLSHEENLAIYGKCANPEGHGHDYGLEISVAGEVDPRSGRILDRGHLDALVESHVLSRLSHAFLNDDPAFGTRVPTAENIALMVHETLSGPIADLAGARLVRVRVQETRRNGFACGEWA